MNFFFFNPHPTLRQFIKGYSFLIADTADRIKAKPLPDGLSSEIGILLHSKFRVKYAGKPEEPMKNFMGGVDHNMEYLCSYEAPFFYIGITPCPYANRYLFKETPADFHSHVDLQFIFKNQYHQLIDQLENCTNPVSCCRVLDKFFLSLVKNARWIDDRSSFIFNNPSKLAQCYSVMDLCELLYMTPRSLQRYFHDIIGISPKRFLQINRINRLLHDIKFDRQHKLSEIAFDYHYSDQSHLYADFKTATNFTPGYFRKNSDKIFINYSRHLIILNDFSDHHTHDKTP